MTRKSTKKADVSIRCSECGDTVASTNALSDCFECTRITNACEPCIQDHMAEEHDESDEYDDD